MSSARPDNSPASQGQQAGGVPSRVQARVRELLEPESQTADPSNQAFANFFKCSPDPILLFDSSGAIVAKNQRASQFWDGSRGFLPASVSAEVVEVAECGTSLCHIGKSQLVEVPSARGPRFFLPNIFLLLPPEEADGSDEEGSGIVACVMKDETAWMRSETIRNNLLASISHELNTPLTSARVALYLLAEQQIGELNKNQAEMVGRAKEDLDREIASIRNVLALMRSDRIDTGGASADTHDLHEVLDEVLIELREQTDALELTMNRFDSDQPLLVRMEHETIRLITKQIFSCVIKYVEKGAVIDIITIVDEKDRLLKLVSSDPALIEALPDDLFSLPIDSDDMRQLGCVDLGLRVAQEIVCQHAGGIRTEQTAQAATLTLSFPRPDETEKQS